MNIFKVIASSKKGFFEEQSSVILAWLLNPYMDHGLGFTFFREFLANVAPEILKELDKSLQYILRSERNSEKLNFTSDIEYNVNRSFIDIVFFVNNFIISIENKINVESASDENQLVLQYEELKKRFGEKYKILIVFLVPDEMHPNIVKEYKALESKYQNCDDRFKIINWDVICNIIKYIIEQDSKCEINPIDDYLRHTLKALSTFIDDDFSGYYFENVKIYGNMNPLSEGRKTLDEIHRDGSIKFVGVNYGIIGLLSLSKEELEKKTFQFTSETIDSYRWLSRDLFIVIGDSIINNKFINVDWINYINSRFPYNIIYNIAINTDKTFYIGIKGGETSLENMKNEEIEKSQWGLSLKKENNQWVEKKKYIEIFNKKGISV
jgi:uncharacterized membrane protein